MKVSVKKKSATEASFLCGYLNKYLNPHERVVSLNEVIAVEFTGHELLGFLRQYMEYVDSKTKYTEEDDEEDDNDITATSEYWKDFLEPSITIIDPDGWDRANFEYSFNAELVTRKEFYKRLARSTIEGSYRKPIKKEGEQNEDAHT